MLALVLWPRLCWITTAQGSFGASLENIRKQQRGEPRPEGPCECLHKHSLAALLLADNLAQLERVLEEHVRHEMLEATHAELVARRLALHEPPRPVHLPYGEGASAAM